MAHGTPGAGETERRRGEGLGDRVKIRGNLRLCHGVKRLLRFSNQLADSRRDVFRADRREINKTVKIKKGILRHRQILFPKLNSCKKKKASGNRRGKLFSS